jgi:hypothetical protein
VQYHLIALVGQRKALGIARSSVRDYRDELIEERGFLSGTGCIAR